MAIPVLFSMPVVIAFSPELSGWPLFPKTLNNSDAHSMSGQRRQQPEGVAVGSAFRHDGKYRGEYHEAFGEAAASVA